jgi:HAMP domain-containing protein
MTDEMNDLLQAVAAEWGQGSQEHNIARDVCKLANKEIEALTAEVERLREHLSSALETLRDAGVCDDKCSLCNEAFAALEKQP